ncbi:MAG: TatD family hydrolase [Mycoplasmataceae bacterium]|jgi:TatD DNase family protein|nr:TatD family hydrolase [Mycoplasmataceae bacterium]
MKYYDVHTHLNCDPLTKDVERIANTCLSKGILINDIGVDIPSSLVAVQHAKQFENVFACVGVHPSDTNKTPLKICIKELEGMLKDKDRNKIIAIGETGLDFFHKPYNEEEQTSFFIAHIALARKYNLPLMVHVRDAFEKCYEILHKHAQGLKIIIHCYNGSIAITHKLNNLNCFFSIPGIITFKNAHELKEVIKIIPLNKLLSETDAPWLTPEPHRGKTNTPEYIDLIVNKIGELLKLSEQDVQETLLNNAIQLFQNK